MDRVRGSPWFPTYQFLGSYTIPRKVHQPSQSQEDRDGQAGHNLDHVQTIFLPSLCYRDQLDTAGMARKRKSREETETESESGELSNSSTDSSDSSDSSDLSSEDVEVREEPVRDDHGPPSNEAALSTFYRDKKRVDAREVSCVIHKKTLDLYFKGILEDRKLDREGRNALSERYFLSPKQFQKLSPPTLEGTRLHFIGDMEFGKLSEKLLNLHRYLSVGLQLFFLWKKCWILLRIKV